MANWVVGNLQNAIGTWNDKLNEIWTLVTQDPETFKDGAIWEVIKNINGAVQAIRFSITCTIFCSRSNANVSETFTKSKSPNTP